MASRFVVRLTVSSSGERMPVLVWRSSGLPHFDANLFALLMMRMRGRAASTAEQALRAVGLLLDFQAERNIDWSARLASGRLFQNEEIDALTVHLRQAIRASGSPGQGPHRTVVAFAGGLDRRGHGEVQGEVSATRLSYVAAYLEWYADARLRAMRLPLQTAALLLQRVQADLRALRKRRDSASGTSNVRQGLTSEQQKLLLDICAGAGVRNPWKQEFVQVRNALLVRWLLALGLRRGELLGVTLDQLDMQRRRVNIVLRPDDPSDSRLYQPNAKTRGRTLDLPSDLAVATHDFIVKHRSKIKSARGHGFLFTSSSGAPLALDTVAAIFLDIRRAAAGRLPAVTPHTLRYTWNDAFSAFCDVQKVPANDERRHREYLMGWAPGSEAAAVYTKRHVEESARKALLQMSR